MIAELHYSNTNTYLIRSRKTAILWDTGWAGTFPLLCKALGEQKLKLQEIGCLLVSHFHPDHMGIAQELADNGVKLVIADVQRDFLHAADAVFEREGNTAFRPIRDEAVQVVKIAESRAFLQTLGIAGELLHTPGHSDDSISLWLDKEKALFVGDLNPLYELELHKGTQIAASWDMLLQKRPRRVYYGHARTAELGKHRFSAQAIEDDRYALVKAITKRIKKGLSAEEIAEQTGADLTFVRDVARMYLTHPNVSVQGILDRIEIKGK